MACARCTHGERHNGHVSGRRQLVNDSSESRVVHIQPTRKRITAPVHTRSLLTRRRRSFRIHLTLAENLSDIILHKLDMLHAHAPVSANPRA